MSSEVSNSKRFLFWIFGIFVLLLLLGMGISFFTKNKETTNEPVTKLRYCGAELEELCILSFGRDVDENLVVNLYVPDKDFPDFKLNIKRRAGKSEYECEKFTEVPTSVFCYGEMISLQERMEVSLISIDGESLLAFGNLTLDAILISGQYPTNGNVPVSIQGTKTPTSETDTDSANVTSTPETSYPNPSYP